RAETGRLYVEDPSQLHAIRIATTDFDHWKYRVWIPEARGYWLWTEHQNIPDEDFPEQGSGGTLEPGEHVIELKLTEQPDDSNRLQMAVIVDGRLSSTTTLYERKEDWIDNDEVGGRVASARGVGSEVATSKPDKPFTLLRYRTQKPVVLRRDAAGKVSSHRLQRIEEPTDGVMLWIAPVEGL
ncbi:MAG: hypothetical protein AAGF31_09415, partial [Planctomycetota bacterium]